MSAISSTLTQQRQRNFQFFYFNQISFQWHLSVIKYVMAHLAGIDKGPILDWADDNGLLEHFRKWKKKVEILFWGPLNGANDAVKCNYIIYWSGEPGMELVDKWETERKITDTNHNQIDRYLTLLEEHISLKSNALIMIVELKRLSRFHELRGLPHQSS